MPPFRKDFILNIKIICGQMEVIPARPDLNYEKIIHCITKSTPGAGRIFSLLCRKCAYPVILSVTSGNKQLLEDCEYYAQQIVAHSQDLCVIFGGFALERDKHNEDGHMRKYNAAFVCQNGKSGCPVTQDAISLSKTPCPITANLTTAVISTACTNYARRNRCITKTIQPITIDIKGASNPTGIMLCEDGWTENYQLDTAQVLADNGAQLLCNLSPLYLGQKTINANASSVPRRTKPLCPCLLQQRRYAK